MKFFPFPHSYHDKRLYGKVSWLYIGVRVIKLFTLPPEANQRAKKLFRKVLWLYIGITSVVIGLWGLGLIAVYSYISHVLHQEHQEELKVLVEVAAPSLEMAKTQSGFFSNDLVVAHWLELELHSQSLEWFDADGKLIIREGRVFPANSLPEATTLPMDGLVEKDMGQNLYIVTLPVFEAGELVGFVRASESLRIIQTPLRKLRWGLFLGGGLGVGTMILSGIFLAKLALEPFIQSYQRLRQFTADASHELRTPLTIIQTGLDVMLAKTDQLNSSDLATINSMNNATHKLRQLTNALLLLARKDQTVELPQQIIPLHELLEELVDTFELVAEEHGIRLGYNQVSTATVKGNNSQLVQLFSNLLQNGIQYTIAGGSVTITLTQLHKRAIVTITDTGIGIAPEDIPYVFERFWRADQARSRQEGGLGLGLAIAYDIVKQHQGEINIQSQVGYGTTLEVKFLIAD